jgi:hypothetical protein
MSDETKVWLALVGLVAVFIVVGGALIYATEKDKAALRQAACVNPETVACALAVRQ